MPRNIPSRSGCRVKPVVGLSKMMKGLRDYELLKGGDAEAERRARSSGGRRKRNGK